MLVVLTIASVFSFVMSPHNSFTFTGPISAVVATSDGKTISQQK